MLLGLDFHNIIALSTPYFKGAKSFFIKNKYLKAINYKNT
jgi:hypothetical protein